jgi:hypothetical protein
VTVCSYHCHHCQSHFSTYRALSAHRTPEDCLEPADDGRFAAVSTDAKCLIQRVPYTPWEPGNPEVFPADGKHTRDGGWSRDNPRWQRVAKPVTVWKLVGAKAGELEEAAAA